EERPPLPVRERYELRGGRYQLAGVTPLRDGEAAPLVDKPNPARTRLVLPTDPRPPPDTPAPDSEQVQRVEHVQLEIAYGEPVFELVGRHAYVDAEARARVLERG